MGLKSRFHIIIASGFGLLITLAAWSLLSPDSPVHQYLQHHYDIPSPEFLNFLAYIQIIPTIVATIVSGNIHGGGQGIYWVLAFAQWFFIGLGMSYFAGIFVGKKNLSGTRH